MLDQPLVDVDYAPPDHEWQDLPVFACRGSGDQQYDAMRKMVARGVDLNVLHFDGGKSPLHLAAERGYATAGPAA